MYSNPRPQNNPVGLFNQVDYDAQTGCWNFTGSRNYKGYGHSRWNGKQMATHKLAAILWLGYKPESGLHVLHRCDNPSCFNPKHLFLGTNQENQIDSVLKGRHWNTRKTHCAQGHPYDDVNTLYLTISNGKLERRCKICYSAAGKRYRDRRKEG